MQFSNLQPIGAPGGFGQVYKCNDENGIIFALKMLIKFEGEASLRFDREVRIMSRLQHPNIIKVIASNLQVMNKFYVMPLYSQSLLQLIPTIAQNSYEQYRVITTLLNAVSYLHSEGVFHRDLKPANVLCNTTTDLAITDFGLSIQESSNSSTLTQYVNYGTIRYCSPEQQSNMHQVDHRTDIYALGYIIEDILSNFGSIPITDNTLKYIIERCTNKQRDNRFNSVDEIQNIITAYYSKLFAWNTQNAIDSLLLKVKDHSINQSELITLANQILSDNDGEKIENFFHDIPSTLYSWLEQNHFDLLRNLVEVVCKYWNQGGWPFSYIDFVADTSISIFEASNSPSIRGLVLYRLIDLANYYNRWYAMGIATKLVVCIDDDFALQAEFASHIKASKINLLNILPDGYCLPEMIKKLYE